MKKYTIDTNENREFLSTNARAILDFGRRFPSPGGSSYYLGDDGTPWKDRNRETWITSRMAHVYSIGSMLGDDGSRELAAAAIRGLNGELKDKANGGWYAGLTKDGGIVNGKQCYAHAFVILAATSGVLAGIEGADELLKDAIRIYDDKFWNEEEGLSCDTWNTEFTVLDDYRGINANMHTVEAFLAAADCFDAVGEAAAADFFDATGDDAVSGCSHGTGKAATGQTSITAEGARYRARAGRIIDHVIGWAKDNDYRIPEHFTKEWAPDLDMNKEKPDDPFKPYGATPGHGIEWARLITQYALSIGRASMGTSGALDFSSVASEYIETACRLYDRAISDAWNSDGAPGIVYTTDWSGHPVVRDRMHWTLAEAINTSAVLYRVTKDQKYADDYAEFMRYLDETVLDHSCGSWFHQLDEHNNLKETVWPGKSDLYHAFQAMLIPYADPAVSIAASASLIREANPAVPDL